MASSEFGSQSSGCFLHPIGYNRRVKIRSISFRGFQPANEAASRMGRGNSARDTKPELLLRRALRKRGIRYRLHDRRLTGTPDIVLPRERIAIFCDGDFWHGRSWAKRRKKLRDGANSSYWIAKIGGNIRRDRRVNRTLRRFHWSAIRVWESSIRRDPEAVAERIVSRIHRMRNGRR
jgi:DNA mismatch endonuclease, patch repair protein